MTQFNYLQKSSYTSTFSVEIQIVFVNFLMTYKSTVSPIFAHKYLDCTNKLLSVNN